MTKNGKVWGATRLIKSHPSVEVHHISIKAGGKCSKHLHRTKINGFYVLSGELAVDVWKTGYPLIDLTNLVAGEYMEVLPGEFHRFTALTDVEALEIYFTNFDPDDIVRED